MVQPDLSIFQHLIELIYNENKEEEQRLCKCVDWDEMKLICFFLLLFFLLIIWKVN